MNKTETLQAAEVMRRAAEGEVMVTSIGIGDTGGWIVVNPSWDWSKYSYQTLEFPSPPPNSFWHNPANLTATQVGVHEGWRLLLERELSKTPQDAEAWMDANLWGASLWRGRECNPKFTLRTKSPLPEAKADSMAVAVAWSSYSIGKKPEEYAQAWADFIGGWQACKEHYKIKD